MTPPPEQADNLFERLPFGGCVDRVDWVAARCAGRRVLDLGCLDETAFLAKRGGSRWLHGEIVQRAGAVLGIDASARLPELRRQYPEPLGRIRQGSFAEMGAILRAEDFAPEVIVAGELIEHLDRPLDLFELVAPVAGEFGAELIVTTPNPFAYQSFLLALAGRESQHVDHVGLLSPKILRRVAGRSGMRLVEMRTAFTEYHEFMAGGSRFRRPLGLADRCVFRPAQRLFPGVAGTLIMVFRTAADCLITHGG